MFERVFVTVGTTSFQKLVQLLVSDKAVDQFEKWGVKEVRIQGGNKSIQKENNQWKAKGIQFEIYDYKPSIMQDMEWGDLIICHAGAGTTIEALDLGKILITVPNDALMDNHQMELADKLAEGNYAFMSTLEEFFDKIVDLDVSSIKPFPKAQPELFHEHLNVVMSDFFNKAKKQQ